MGPPWTKGRERAEKDLRSPKRAQFKFMRKQTGVWGGGGGKMEIRSSDDDGILRLGIVVRRLGNRYHTLWRISN